MVVLTLLIYHLLLYLTYQLRTLRINILCTPSWRNKAVYPPTAHLFCPTTEKGCNKHHCCSFPTCIQQSSLPMETSTAGFLLLQALFALLQTLFYSCYSLPSQNISILSVCFSLWCSEFSYILLQSSILHHGNSAPIDRKAVNYKNRLWTYNPSLSPAHFHYNRRTSRGPEFSVNPMLC